MSEFKLERIARNQAQALARTLELMAEESYLDLYGRELLGKVHYWLDQTKKIKTNA